MGSVDGLMNEFVYLWLVVGTVWILACFVIFLMGGYDAMRELGHFEAYFDFCRAFGFFLVVSGLLASVFLYLPYLLPGF